MRKKAFLTVAFLLSASAASAIPPESGAACSAPVAPTGELAAWTAPVPAKASGDATALDGSALSVGRAATLALLPTSEIKFPAKPDNPGGSVSHGGLARLHVDRAGTYRVALGGRAWIDVVSGAKALKSVGHGHGPACSGIRKMVDFKLMPGDYVIQIAASGKPEIVVMVAMMR